MSLDAMVEETGVAIKARWSFVASYRIGEVRDSADIWSAHSEFRSRPPIRTGAELLSSDHHTVVTVPRGYIPGQLSYALVCPMYPRET